MPTVTFRADRGPKREGAAGDASVLRVVHVQVAPGTTIREAAREAGLDLISPCGGRGRCGKCAVEVVEGSSGPAPAPTDGERAFLAADALARGVRLACLSEVASDLEVRVPWTSRASFAEILEDGECVSFPLDPAVRLVDVALPAPSLEDPADDIERLARALGPVGEGIECELAAARALPAVLRANGFEARAVLREGQGRGAARLLEVLPPRPLGREGDRARALAAAFDIGTTTIAGSLLDLTTGERLATASRTNPQAAFGDDVISRMDHASRGEAGLDELRRSVVDCLDAILDELVQSAGAAGGSGASRDDVRDITVAGNTVMTHLFLGLPPGAIATVPFTPVVTRAMSVRADEVGLCASASARVWTAPSAAAYVGGDVVAGLAAVGFGSFERETLYIDIGTNGEVVAGSGERALCAATAAGPAFEGARIRCGMRASPGAISHVELVKNEGCDGIALEVIGGVPPAGLCGTGLVDLVAALLRAGVIDPSGRIVTDAPGALGGRVRETESGPEFVVAPGPKGDADTEVVLTQRDVRELQLGKGAIAAGARVLLERLGVAATDLGSVLLAGAFGSTIRPSSAVAIGLLPAGIDPSRVRAVGNAAASGARAAACSMTARKETERLARLLEPVELSADPGFRTRFAEAMIFPSPEPQ